MSLLDKNFPFGLENNLLNEKEINDKGLKFIAQIKTDDIIDNSENLKEFFKKIKLSCQNKRLWALFGRDDAENWLPLQIGSVYAEQKDIISEIIPDFKRMIPFNPKTDVKEWKSEYHGNIMKVEIGRDTKCQIYAKLREKFKFLSVAILTNEEFVSKDDSFITKYQIKEIELADKLKPLIWNASPIEKKYKNSDWNSKK